MNYATFLISFWVGVSVAWGAEPKDEAARLLDASGLKGGLIVHLGCGDGKLTAALHAGESFLVHGLDAEAKNVETARQNIQALGLHGKVAVEQWSGQRLPYAEELVNLIVVSGESPVSNDELLRVLAPNGVALFVNSHSANLIPHSANLQSAILILQLKKPWPKDIDEWTHHLHDAGGNAVAHDLEVGPPQHLQWTDGPRWSRSHGWSPSTSATVSAGGRLFYISDESPTGMGWHDWVAVLNFVPCLCS